MNPMLEGALACQRLGLRVLPCQRRGKAAWLKGWPDRASLDERDAREWWAEQPESNVAIATGGEGGVVVIDTDSREGTRWIQDYVADFPTLTVATAKGRHFYYRTPPGYRVKSVSKILHDDIDVKGSGGYVLAPPSIHPTGRAYTWCENRPIAELPEDLLALLVARGIATSASYEPPKLKVVGPDFVPAGTEPIRHPKRWAEDRLDAKARELANMAPGTGRNSFLYASVAAMKAAVELDLVSRLDVDTRLGIAAEAAGPSKHNVAATIASAWSTPADRAEVDALRTRIEAGGHAEALAEREAVARERRARQRSPGAPPPEAEIAPQPPPAPSLTRGGKKQIFYGVALDSVEPVRKRFLWDPYLPLGELTFLEGRPKVGKTTIFYDIVARLTRGGPLPGEVERFEPAKVLILDYENDLESWIRPSLGGSGAALERVKVVKAHRNRVLDIARDMGQLEDFLREEGPRLLLIDGFMSLLNGLDANAETDIRPKLVALIELSRRLDMALVGIRHHRKAGSRGGGAIDAGTGSVGFSAMSRSILTVGRNYLGETFLAASGQFVRSNTLAHQYRLEGVPDFPVPRAVWVTARAVSADDISRAPAEQADEMAKAELEEYIEAFVENQGGVCLRRDLSRHLHGHGFAEREVRTALARMKADGWMVKKGLSGDFRVFAPHPKHHV